MTDNGSTPTIKRDGFRRWFGQEPARSAPKSDWLKPPPPPAKRTESPVITAARSLPHGTGCSAELRRAIDEEIVARRAETHTSDGPAAPTIAEDLVVVRDGLPDWWSEGGHLLLSVAGATLPRIGLGMIRRPSYRSLVVVGRDAVLDAINVMQEDAMIVLGDRMRLNTSSIGCGRGTVLIGEDSTGTWMTAIDVRNGGIAIIGADCMWAAGVSLMTDDTHAIRDAETGQRLNRYGGRIVVERHVWLGEQTKLMGDCRIGHDSVVGTGSFVKNTVIPPNTISVGRPARPIRSGVTWSRQDLP